MGKNRSCNLAGKSSQRIWQPHRSINLGSIPSYSLTPSVAPEGIPVQPTRWWWGRGALPARLSLSERSEQRRPQKFCSASPRRAYMEGATRVKGRKNHYRKQIGYQEDLSWFHWGLLSRSGAAPKTSASDTGHGETRSTCVGLETGLRCGEGAGGHGRATFGVSITLKWKPNHIPRKEPQWAFVIWFLLFFNGAKPETGDDMIFLFILWLCLKVPYDSCNTKTISLLLWALPSGFISFLCTSPFLLPRNEDLVWPAKVTFVK